LLKLKISAMYIRRNTLERPVTGKANGKGVETQQSTFNAAVNAPAEQTNFDANDPGSVAVNPVMKPAIAGDSPMSSGVRGLASFTFTLDNSVPVVPTLFFIGGSDVPNLAGVTAVPPTSGNKDVASMLRSFNYAPMSISLIVIRTSSNPQQLQQPMTYFNNVDINGSEGGRGGVPIDTASNPTFQQDLTYRLKFSDADAIGFAWNKMLTYLVLAGEVVTMTFVPSFAWNRQA